MKNGVGIVIRCKNIFTFQKRQLVRILILAMVIWQTDAFAEKLTIKLTPYNHETVRIGKIDYYQTHKYSFKSSGKITEMAVDVGDRFEQGQILASVDTNELNAQLNSFLAEKAFVNEEVKRLSKLRKTNSVSASELERLKSRSSQLKASIVNVRKYLESTSIVAPYDGVVLSRFAELGEWVGVGQPILTVAKSDSNLVIKVAIQENEIDTISANAQYKAAFSRSNQTLDANFRSFEPIPNPSTGLYTLNLNTEVNDLIIGQLVNVHVPQATRFVFKVPLKFVDLDFNNTALVNVIDQSGKTIAQRFEVVDIFDEVAMLAPGNVIELKLNYVK